MAASKKVESVEHVGDPSHSSHLLSGLNDLRNQAIFCDVTIIVGGQRFPAHKAVLTSASDYFKGMFSSGFQESTMREVTVPGTAESFAQILEFIYTGYFKLTSSTVVGILEIACYMVLTKAVKSCAKYLEEFKDKLAIEDCFEVWSFATNHSNLSNIAQLYGRQVVQNFPMCVHAEAFLENCTARVMIEILGDKDIESDTVTEEQILEVTVVWLKHDWEQRKVHAIDLLKKIRLGLVPIDRLHEILGEELLSIPECKDLVAQVVHLNDTMDATSSLLMRKHPDLFATRNTITAMIYLDKDSNNAYTMIEMFCKTKSGPHYKLDKMADHPRIMEARATQNSNLYPYHENDDLHDHMKIMVSDTGHLYAAGGKDMKGGLGRDDRDLYVVRKHRNWDWLDENNFYRYDQRTNNWIILAPMKEARFFLRVFQADEYIYSLGVPAKQVPIEMVHVLERYSFANNEWEVISREIGFMATSVAVVDGYILMKGSNTDQRYVNNKVALYKMAENKVYDVHTSGLFETRFHLAAHDNKVYLRPAYQRTEAGNLHKLAYNFAGNNPSIGITGEIVEDADIIKAVQDQQQPYGAVEYTFDKRRLGLYHYHC